MFKEKKVEPCNLAEKEKKEHPDSIIEIIDMWDAQAKKLKKSA